MGTLHTSELVIIASAEQVEVPADSMHFYLFQQVSEYFVHTPDGWDYYENGSDNDSTVLLA